MQRRGAGRPAGSKAKRAAQAKPASSPAQPAAAAAESAADDQHAAAAAAQADVRRLRTDAHLTRLGEGDLNKFFDLPQSLIPEAFQAHFSAAAARQETVIDKGGCKGLQREFDATNSSHVLYRRVLHDLIQLSGSGRRQRVLLDGPSGSGKSVALASLVARARSDGAVVAYIPSAFALTQDAFFFRNDAGGWDTPDVSRMLMRSTLAAHRQQLEQLPAQSRAGDTLADVAAAGIASNKPEVCTSAAVDFITDLSTVSSAPVMIAVDDWNALYWRTAYHEWLNNKKRVRVDATQVRLVAAVRQLLEGPDLPQSQPGVAACFRVVAAMTHSAAISEQLLVPRPRGSNVQVPRLSLEEQTQWMQHYIAQGAVTAPGAPDDTVSASAYFLTDGNPIELRKYAGVMC